MPFAIRDIHAPEKYLITGVSVQWGSEKEATRFASFAKADLVRQVPFLWADTEVVEVPELSAYPPEPGGMLVAEEPAEEGVTIAMPSALGPADYISEETLSERDHAEPEEPFVWTTRRGDRIPVTEMTTSRIHNCLRMMWRVGCGGDDRAYQWCIRAFQNELLRRQGLSGRISPLTDEDVLEWLNNED